MIFPQIPKWTISNEFDAGQGKKKVQIIVKEIFSSRQIHLSVQNKIKKNIAGLHDGNNYSTERFRTSSKQFVI